MKQFIVNLTHGGPPSRPIPLEAAERFATCQNELEKIKKLEVGHQVICGNAQVTRIADAQTTSAISAEPETRQTRYALCIDSIKSEYMTVGQLISVVMLMWPQQVGRVLDATKTMDSGKLAEAYLSTDENVTLRIAKEPKTTIRKVTFRANTITQLTHTVEVEVPQGEDEEEFLNNFQRELDGGDYEQGESDWQDTGWTVLD